MEAAERSVSRVLVSADSLGKALWAAGCSCFTAQKARKWMSYFTGTVMENPNLIGDVTSLYRNTLHLQSEANFRKVGEQWRGQKTWDLVFQKSSWIITCGDECVGSVGNAGLRTGNRREPAWKQVWASTNLGRSICHLKVQTRLLLGARAMVGRNQGSSLCPVCALPGAILSSDSWGLEVCKGWTKLSGCVELIQFPQYLFLVLIFRVWPLHFNLCCGWALLLTASAWSSPLSFHLG